MKTPLFLMALLLSAAVVQAQPVLAFDETQHDFGAIAEQGGPVRYTFTFSNTGDAPLVITQVTASCGCTTPGWTQDPVAPGEQGTITAEYNPMNRPGAFQKYLMVSSNASNKFMRLMILGRVNPKPKAPEQDFPTDMGGLRVRSQYLQFGNTDTEGPVTREFGVHNSSGEPLFIEAYDGPEDVEVRWEPDTLPVFARGKMVVTFDPSKTGTLGYRTVQFRLTTNQVQDNQKPFVVLTTVEEYFPPMTVEELANAPQLMLDKEAHDFMGVDQGDTVRTTFTLHNVGKSPLALREVRPNCACASVSVTEATLEPGASIPLEVIFSSVGRRGIQNKSVTLFTNDPRQPTRDIKFSAVVSVPNN